MTTTRTIDEILLSAALAIFNDGSREVINGNSPEVKQWAKLRTKEAKQDLLSTIKAGLPELENLQEIIKKYGGGSYTAGWASGKNQAQAQLEDYLDSLFNGGEKK